MSSFPTFQQAEQHGRLLMYLELIDRLDHDSTPDYDRRYQLVLESLLAAKRCGFDAGLRIDPEEPDWPVVFIELPTGQVSWHMPAHSKPWDNHTNEQKHERIWACINAQRERHT